MTAREFKDRIAAGDKLAVVMQALWHIPRPKGCLSRERKCLREDHSRYAAHILAALAIAEAKSHAKQLEGFSAEDLKELHAGQVQIACPYCELRMAPEDVKDWVGCDTCRDGEDWLKAALASAGVKK